MSKEITVSVRTESGKGSAGRSRNNGLVPAIMYGKGAETVKLYITQGEVDSTRPALDDEVVLLLDGRKLSARVAEIQINYMKSKVLHVDFCLA